MSQKTTPLESDLDETCDLDQLIAEMADDPEAWKHTINSSLGGRTPQSWIDAGQERIVRDLLRAAKHGMTA